MHAKEIVQFASNLKERLPVLESSLDNFIVGINSSRAPVVVSPRAVHVFQDRLLLYGLPKIAGIDEAQLLRQVVEDDRDVYQILQKMASYNVEQGIAISQQSEQLRNLLLQLQETLQYLPQAFTSSSER